MMEPGAGPNLRCELEIISKPARENVRFQIPQELNGLLPGQNIFETPSLIHEANYRGQSNVNHQKNALQGKKMRAPFQRPH